MQDRETATGENHADTLCWVLQREGRGASGNLFSAGVLSVVCGFSSKLDVKKMAGEEKDCAKDVKLRNHLVSNRFFLILVKSEGKNAIKLEKLKDCVEKHEN